MMDRLETESDQLKVSCCRMPTCKFKRSWIGILACIGLAALAIFISITVVFTVLPRNSTKQTITPNTIVNVYTLNNVTFIQFGTTSTVNTRSVRDAADYEYYDYPTNSSDSSPLTLIPTQAMITSADTQLNQLLSQISATCVISEAMMSSTTTLVLQLEIYFNNRCDNCYQIEVNSLKQIMKPGINVSINTQYQPDCNSNATQAVPTVWVLQIDSNYFNNVAPPNQTTAGSLVQQGDLCFVNETMTTDIISTTIISSTPVVATTAVPAATTQLIKTTAPIDVTTSVPIEVTTTAPIDGTTSVPIGVSTTVPIGLSSTVPIGTTRKPNAAISTKNIPYTMAISSLTKFQYYTFDISVLTKFTNFQFVVVFVTHNNKTIGIDNMNFVAYNNVLQNGDFETNPTDSTKNPWQVASCLNGCSGSMVKGNAASGNYYFQASGNGVTLYQNIKMSNSSVTTVDHVAFWLNSNCQVADLCTVTIDIRLTG